MSGEHLQLRVGNLALVARTARPLQQPTKYKVNVVVKQSLFHKHLQKKKLFPTHSNLVQVFGVHCILNYRIHDVWELRSVCELWHGLQTS